MKQCTTHHHACDCREDDFKKALAACVEYRAKLGKLEAENAELRADKDAFLRHNSILVKLMTEEQKKKALDVLMSRKEAQP
jgi:hypothetical protein